MLEPLGSVDKSAGLLLLRGCGLGPAEFHAWLEAAGVAWAVLRVYYVGEPAPVASAEDLAAALEAEGPPRGAMRLQCYPRSLETWLAVRASGAGRDDGHGPPHPSTAPPTPFLSPSGAAARGALAAAPRLL